MLCFWNFAGVPFLYSKSSIYLLNYYDAATSPSNTVVAVLTVVYICSEKGELN